MLIVVGLALILVLTLATGYFVAQEFAYVAVDRGQLRKAAAGNDRGAVRALRVTDRLSFVLSGAQLGITVTALLVGYLAEPYLGEGLADLAGGAGLSRGAAMTLSVILALLISTVLQMVLGELAPKNLAIARALPLARALAPSTLVYLTAAGPLIRVFDAAANRLLRRVGVEPVEELETGATPEDLMQILTDAEAGGHLDEQTVTLLERGLDFRLHTAREAMTPRVEVVSVRAGDPCTRLVDLLDTGHSRFPVLGPDGVDDVMGMAAITDVLAVAIPLRASTPVSAIAIEPLFLPVGLPLRKVLDRLREEHRQLACVVDEYGGLAGVISLEDIAEELVGPISDEDDLPEPVAVRQPDGSWLVPARWRTDELANLTGFDLREPPGYDTLSGLILSILGRIPVVGDEVDLPTNGPVGSKPRVRARVVTVNRHVADTVRLAEEPQ